MKGGKDGKLKRLTNFFIEALFALERAERGLPHPDSVDPDDIEDPDECRQHVEEIKKNIMDLQRRYGSEVSGLTEKGVKIYRDKISSYFYEIYSDDLLEYPSIDDDTVNQYIKESIDESRKFAGKSKKKSKSSKKKPKQSKKKPKKKSKSSKKKPIKKKKQTKRAKK